MFTGERLTTFDENFSPDLAQHIAMYNYVLPQVAGKTVLDAGCGEGYGTSLLASCAGKIMGVDNSREAVRKASLSYHKSNLEFRHQDIYALDFQDGCFDCICSFQVFEHIRNTERYLKEIYRVLKDGGCLFLSTPNRLTAFSENPYHLREYTPYELEDILKGFFPAVSIKGMFGNEKVQRYQELRKNNVNKILRLDTFKIRRFIPSAMKKWIFGSLAVLVRKRVRLEGEVSFDAITPADFEVTEHAVEKALDIVAICKK